MAWLAGRALAHHVRMQEQKCRYASLPRDARAELSPTVNAEYCITAADSVAATMEVCIARSTVRVAETILTTTELSVVADIGPAFDIVPATGDPLDVCAVFPSAFTAPFVNIIRSYIVHAFFERLFALRPSSTKRIIRMSKNLTSSSS